MGKETNALSCTQFALLSSLYTTTATTCIINAAAATAATATTRYNNDTMTCSPTRGDTGTLLTTRSAASSATREPAGEKIVANAATTVQNGLHRKIPSSSSPSSSSLYDNLWLLLQTIAWIGTISLRSSSIQPSTTSSKKPSSKKNHQKQRLVLSYSWRSLVRSMLIVVLLVNSHDYFYTTTIGGGVDSSVNKSSRMVMFVTGYPIMVQVDEQSERCIRFNIPDGEDAHIAAVVLPSEEELEDHSETMEDWYVNQLYKLCQRRGKHNTLQREIIDEAPDSVMIAKSNYLQSIHGVEETDVRIKITRTPTTNPTKYQHNFVTKYFKPSVINYIGRNSEAKEKVGATSTDPDVPGVVKNHEMEHIEGYGLCFDNVNSERQVQVIYDIVLTSDTPYQDDAEGAEADRKNMMNLGFDKERHLTPLESSLDSSINAANLILREMKYMESREQRMRKTAESINIRVRWFSYVSVSVLLSVTYIQVTYLKRYFHKKKLM